MIESQQQREKKKHRTSPSISCFHITCLWLRRGIVSPELDSRLICNLCQDFWLKETLDRFYVASRHLQCYKMITITGQCRWKPYGEVQVRRTRQDRTEKKTKGMMKLELLHRRSLDHRISSTHHFDDLWCRQLWMTRVTRLDRVAIPQHKMHLVFCRVSTTINNNNNSNSKCLDGQGICLPLVRYSVVFANRLCGRFQPEQQEGIRTKEKEDSEDIEA